MIGWILNVARLAIKEFICSYTKLEVHPKNLFGKVILITGGNEGIGYETAIQLAKMGAKIIIASRNKKKSELAVEKIKQSSHNEDIHFLQLDLGSIQSVNQFSAQFKKEYDQLDILINNAGAVFLDYAQTEDGLERTCQVNHIGPTLLTINLLPTLLKSEDSRVIFVSSMMHNFSNLKLPRDLELPQSQFIGIGEYSKSKKMNILTSNELASQLKSKPIKVMSLHPGYVYSNFGQDNFQSFFRKLISYVFVHPMQLLLARNTEQGAITTVFVATDDNVISGEYYDSCKIEERDEQSKDAELGKDLWNRTLDILKLDKNTISKL